MTRLVTFILLLISVGAPGALDPLCPYRAIHGRQSRLRSFLDAISHMGPKARVDPRTQTEMLRRARLDLDQNKVSATDTETRGPDSVEKTSALEIDPIADKSPANRFAKWVKDTFGAKVVYNPGALGRADMVAGYDPVSRTLFISHETLASLRFDGSLRHEMTHVILSEHRRQGNDSVFHGGFRPLVAGRAMLEGKVGYGERLSFEELAAHPVNVAYEAGELLTAVRLGALPETTAALKASLKTQIASARAVAEQSRTMFDRTVTELAREAGGPAMTFHEFAEPGGTQAKPSAAMGVVRIKVDVTRDSTTSAFFVDVIVKPETATQLREAALDKGKAGDSARARLRELAVQKLSTLRDLAQAEIQQFTAAEKLAEGPVTADTVTALHTAATAPRVNVREKMPRLRN